METVTYEKLMIWTPRWIPFGWSNQGEWGG